MLFPSNTLFWSILATCHFLHQPYLFHCTVFVNDFSFMYCFSFSLFCFTLHILYLQITQIYHYLHFYVLHNNTFTINTFFILLNFNVTFLQYPQCYCKHFCKMFCNTGQYLLQCRFYHMIIHYLDNHRQSGQMLYIL